MERHNYQNVLINKPWGNEYLLFETDTLGVWHLCINQGQKTSLHGHPNKKTGLIVLKGVAQVSFLNGKHLLLPGDKIIIRQGVFHSTKAVTPLELLEVETPNWKEDIVRLEDSYGRAGQPFEGNGAHSYFPYKPEVSATGINMGECRVVADHFESWPAISSDCFTAECKFLFIDASIYSGNLKVCGEGDIIDGASLRRLIGKFEAKPGLIWRIWRNAE